MDPSSGAARHPGSDSPGITSPLAGEVAQLGPQGLSEARWGVAPRDEFEAPPLAPLRAGGPSCATLPARGRETDCQVSELRLRRLLLVVVLDLFEVRVDHVLGRLVAARGLGLGFRLAGLVHGFAE